MEDTPSQVPPQNASSEETQHPTSSTNTILTWFSRNPWLGIVATVCTIVGLPLSVYLYFVGQRFRELEVYVSPVESIISKGGVPSNLKILFNNAEVRSDVTAVQVQLWNRGKEPIRTEHILEDVVLSTGPSTHILEATVQKQARSVSRITLDTTRIAVGELGLSWKILEEGDGALIQLIVAGQARNVSLSGVVEGQRGIWLRRGEYPSQRGKPYYRTLPAAGWVRDIGDSIAAALILFGFIFMLTDLSRDAGRLLTGELQKHRVLSALVSKGRELSARVKHVCRAHATLAAVIGLLLGAVWIKATSVPVPPFGP